MELLLYGSSNFDSDQNHKVLGSCISFILKSERFNRLFLSKQMKLVDNKISDLYSYLICQSYKNS